MAHVILRVETHVTPGTVVEVWPEVGVGVGAMAWCGAGGVAWCRRGCRRCGLINLAIGRMFNCHICSSNQAPH